MNAGIEVGLIYEDCGYYPVLCTYINVDEDELQGICLIDGSVRGGCSLRHCGPELLTVEQALVIKRDHGAYVAHRVAGGDLPVA